ncbi:MAG TPA: hypothetical protein VLA17_11165, partial [Candidatus Limnocylindria bacterium]|nr:hypothetical protein [Candidatus Limnocylindria bacterium]
MMTNRKPRTGLLVTTALVSATLAVAATALSATMMGGARAAIDTAPGEIGSAASPSVSANAASELFDPAYLVRSACGVKARTFAASPFMVVAKAAAARTMEPAEDETAPPLWDNLGTVTMPVTTSSPLAQSYFD